MPPKQSQQVETFHVSFAIRRSESAAANGEMYERVGRPSCVYGLRSISGGRSIVLPWTTEGHLASEKDKTDCTF